MAKETRKLPAQPAAANAAAASAGEAGDWGDTAAQPAPQTTAAVVQQQIAAKTSEDVGRQELAATDPIEATLKAVEAKIEKATDVGKAFELLKELEETPATTTLEKNIKKVCVERVKRHCYDIQQGLPLVKMGANELAKEPGLNSSSIRAQRLELEARTNSDIKDLLEQIETLNKQSAEQKKD